MVASLFGRPSFSMRALSAVSNRPDPITRPGCTLSDAIDSFVSINDMTIKFMGSVVELKYSLSVPEEALAEQRRLDRMFDDWLLNFENVAKENQSSNGVNLVVRKPHFSMPHPLTHPFNRSWDVIWRSRYGYAPVSHHTKLLGTNFALNSRRFSTGCNVSWTMSTDFQISSQRSSPSNLEFCPLFSLWQESADMERSVGGL
jgi:hypothetical protein